MEGRVSSLNYMSAYNSKQYLASKANNQHFKTMMRLTASIWAEQLQQIDDSFSPQPSLFEQLIAEDPQSASSSLLSHRPIHMCFNHKRKRIVAPYKLKRHNKRGVKRRPTQAVQTQDSQNLGSDEQTKTKSQCSQPQKQPGLTLKGKKLQGCHCNHLRCDKRYCSCFKSGNSCGASCQCKSCANPIKVKKIIKTATIILEPFWDLNWEPNSPNSS